ncbi:MAG: adenylosuccinate synthase [Bacteroidia bacterium]|nr:adenylosuccinate synthase [Bacteroidia bacterium]
MNVDVLLGLQWGDEGKGKVVDVLAPGYQIISRFQGGPNAGHTLEFEGRKHVLHIIPSGVFRNDCINIIGNGVVIDPIIFEKEITGLIPYCPNIFKNLIISKRAQLILPTHKLLDAAYEAEKGCAKIGSTLKGIGPTYTDKISRNGLRVGDILTSDFLKKYTELKNKHIQILNMLNFKFELEEEEKKLFNSIELIKKFSLIDSEIEINNLISKGKKILAEGAQGTMLDIDFGSYPFVTSSNTVCAGACTGLGIAPSKIGEVYGLFKAYCTRVGSGPFPTELNDSDGEKLRKIGNEFGSTTGRPRRCGWVDLVALKYSVMINGVTGLIMTKADVLNEFDEIKAAVSYSIDGEIFENIPYDLSHNILPQYKSFKGWKKDISKNTNKNELPLELKEYIKFIEDFVKVPVIMVSVGPDRKAIVDLR